MVLRFDRSFHVYIQASEMTEPSNELSVYPSTTAV